MTTDTERLQMLCVRWDGYPCTIICDRYGGSYSGGWWHAWPLEADEIPDSVNGGDLDSMSFWTNDIRQYCGLGESPAEAYAELKRKLMRTK